MSPTTPSTLELATRESDGFRVSLLWHPDERSITVWLEDPDGGDCRRIAVAPDRAIVAFFNPLAYAA